MDFYLKHLKQAETSGPVKDWVTEFLEAKRNDNLSKRHLSDLKSQLGKFTTDHGATHVCDISPSTIEDWLNQLNLILLNRPLDPSSSMDSVISLSEGITAESSSTIRCSIMAISSARRNPDIKIKEEHVKKRWKAERICITVKEDNGSIGHRG